MRDQITLEILKEDFGLPNIIIYAIPVMVLLAVLEMYLGYKKKRKIYEKKDFWANVGVGVGYILQGLVAKALLFFLIIWAYNIAPVQWPLTWWSAIACYVVFDFFRFYAHKLSHEINVLWATHVTHHSSERFNLSTSFRLSWTQMIKVFLFVPVGLFGFHPLWFFLAHQLGVLYQYWVHTELIGKLPKPIEFIFVTPSHHRVHHGRNDKYLDRNYGSTLIIWDRMFGSFQEEEEKVDFGITKPLRSYNIFTINFHVWSDIVHDLRHSRSFKESMAILFRGPGKYHREEFDPKPSLTSDTSGVSNVGPSKRAS